MPKQSFIALIEKGTVEDCFIITKTGMCFATGGNDNSGIDSVSIQNAYYVGDIYFMEQMPPNLLPLPFGITQLLRNINSCYYRIEDLYDLSIKYSGSIDINFVNQIKSALYGECVTDGHLRNINTFSGWDIAKKVERTNELWGIDDGNGIPGEIPEQSDVAITVKVKSIDLSYFDYEFIQCVILDGQNIIQPISMSNDSEGNSEFYFGMQVFDESIKHVQIGVHGTKKSFEPEGESYWINYCRTNFPDDDTGWLAGVGKTTLQTQVLEASEIPITIEISGFNYICNWNI